jgi:hypothetical protein
MSGSVHKVFTLEHGKNLYETRVITAPIVQAHVNGLPALAYVETTSAKANETGYLEAALSRAQEQLGSRIRKLQNRDIAHDGRQNVAVVYAPNVKTARPTTYQWGETTAIAIPGDASKNFPGTAFLITVKPAEKARSKSAESMVTLPPNEA